MFRRPRIATNLLWVNASVGLVLVAGFVVTILVPRLALVRLGETHYGVYALIVGFSSVMAFADLGLTPGTTRQFAVLLVNGKLGAVRQIVQRNQIVCSRWLLALAVAAGVVLFMAIPVVTTDLVVAYTLFVLSTWITIFSEIRASVARAAGHVTTTYWIRLASLAVYLLVVSGLFLRFNTWPGVSFIFVGQFASSVVRYLLNDLVFRRVLSSAAHATPPVGATLEPYALDAHSAWREAWRVSTPERFNRIIQLVTGFIERPLLVATAGLAFVGSYDLFLRLTLLVSALPGALSEPVVAMLSHDAARPDGQKRFRGALLLARVMNFGFAFLGVGVALALFLGFYSLIFGVQSRIPIELGVLIVIATGMNAITAPGVGAMMARGVVWPCNAKLAIEAVGLAAGVTVGLVAHSGVLFVAFRYLSLVAASASFVAIEVCLEKNRNNA